MAEIAGVEVSDDLCPECLLLGYHRGDCSKLARLESVVEAFSNGDIRDGLLRQWYQKDLPFTLKEMERLRNTIVQLKNKLEKGPCGRCRPKGDVK